LWVKLLGDTQSFYCFRAVFIDLQAIEWVGWLGLKSIFWKIFGNTHDNRILRCKRSRICKKQHYLPKFGYLFPSVGFFDHIFVSLIIVELSKFGKRNFKVIVVTWMPLSFFKRWLKLSLLVRDSLWFNTHNEIQTLSVRHS
jgi:hypothetical protein